jgi:hypothetical protein
LAKAEALIVHNCSELSWKLALFPVRPGEKKGQTEALWTSSPFREVLVIDHTRLAEGIVIPQISEVINATCWELKRSKNQRKVHHTRHVT